MISSKPLLTALQKQVRALEDDLRKCCDQAPDVDAPLRTQYDAAKSGKRTVLTYKAWRDEELTNIAVAWVLACVFVRFLEDNELVETPRLSGVGDRLLRAQDEHELFFRKHPTQTEREYLLNIFEGVGRLPGMREFFDRKHNPLWLASPSGDACRDMWQFWQKTDPVTGATVHDFADPEWNTRFLGDLYQDLSEAARKRYALLQTPAFIEQFILDRTLTPAIEIYGFREVRMIDPTCGSGHFLLGGFARLYALWNEALPGEVPSVIAQHALDQVFGVDLNPNVVAIARFRLLLAALRVSCVTRLRDAYDFKIHVVAGDSLLHGRRFRALESFTTGAQRTFDTEKVFRDELKHHYEVEDVEGLHRILGQQYHAVVGNPPYITVKDKAVSKLYRARYPSCHREYSLSVPFMERFFDLAVKGDGTPQQPAGFVGQITGNTFMKREFGKKLIEEYLPCWDLTHVLDTAGAYIPGHGTPTVILLGKNQPPVSGTIRTVLGIHGEPMTPADPALGFVWQALISQIDHPGSVSEWVSAADSPRAKFHRHPWSIGGGGAAELTEALNQASAQRIGGVSSEIGCTAITGEDEAFVIGNDDAANRLRIENKVPLIEGNLVREWEILGGHTAIWVYDEDYQILDANCMPFAHAMLWPTRRVLKGRKRFSVPIMEQGLKWYEWRELYPTKLRSPISIVFAFVATHNHFVVDRGAKVFKQSAPVIKLKPEFNEEGYIRLTGVLNSSSACFWFKQVAHNKGSTVDEHGARQRTAPFEDFYEFTSTQLASFPIPANQPTQLPIALFQTSTAIQTQSPAALLASWGGPKSGDLRERLANARELAVSHRRQLIACQEELDWQIYNAFGLVAEASPHSSTMVSLPEGEAMDAIPPEGLELGQRAFEIVLARRMAAGDVQTTWFERHGSTPITEVPPHWPAAYRELAERRIARIESDPNIRLIEQPEYKRRWNTERWDKQQEAALRHWLVNRLEGYFFEGSRVCDLGGSFDPGALGFAASDRPHLVSTNQLADVVASDATFLEAAEIYTEASGFSVAKLLRELIEAESVPYLPVFRYKESGLRKRQDWEETWELQRKEDAIEARVRSENAGAGEETLKKMIRKAQEEETGDIPVPPKYSNADFLKNYWKHRGKLDVPKERWITYPGAERAGDDSPLIAWAGWDHLQQAKALSEYFLDAKENQGWSLVRLKPILAGVADLIPWLRQWHNTTDPNLGMGAGDYFAGFLEEECRALGITVAEAGKARFKTSAPA